VDKAVYTFDDLKNWSRETNEPPITLAVLGDPIAHSASPQMQNAALKHCGIQASYARLHISSEQLGETLQLLREHGFLGANLTIPHKRAALPLLDTVDSRAKKLGAVNTLLIEDEQLIGFNTDGPGFSQVIRNEFYLDLHDLRVLVLGAAGGAGRAIATQCAIEGCERLVLVNRTEANLKPIAEELKSYFEADRLKGPCERFITLPWDESVLKKELEHVDLIVNATPLGMKRSDPLPISQSLILPHHLILDMVYGRGRAKLLAAAEEAGARSIGGHALLLYQGALAFEIWFNRKAPIEVMRRALLET